MISLDDARALVVSMCSPLGTTSVPLDDAPGHRLAEPVVVPFDLPPFANASVDGFAINAATLAAVPMTLGVSGATFAGSPPGELEAGTAWRIMTGAAMPAGADAVVMIEDTETHEDGTITITSPVKAGDGWREAGSDKRAGTVLVARGAMITSGALSSLAACGVSSLKVAQRPVISVLSTGDELCDPGVELLPGQIYDANRPALRARLGSYGASVIDLGRIGDSVEAVHEAIARAEAVSDVLVISGGVSVGDADVVRLALDHGPIDDAHWLQVAIRPAKPFAIARTSAGLIICCLPGNPVSALVSLELLASAAFLTMAGDPQAASLQAVPARLSVPITREPDEKTHFIRGILDVDDTGQRLVAPVGVQASHIATALADADVLIEIPDGTGLPSGAVVRVVEFSGR